VALTIFRLGERLYIATVTPPHCKNERMSLQPIELRQLIAELEDIGCHQQDIGDALYEADPEWLDRLD
jgi:hypothetical protein